jgi:ABC-type transporter Mla subunit MlaD
MLQVDATPEPPPAYSSPSEDTQVHDAEAKEIKTDSEPAPASMVGTAVSAAKNAAGNTSDVLKEQLAQAEATIASLKNDLQSGLRQRKTTSTDESTTATPAQNLAQATRQGAEGVPLQIVAVLCLVSFLLAYFFF